MTGASVPECALCHRPLRSSTARARRIGSRCWRKLTPAQRAAIRRDPGAVRAALDQPVPAAHGQLALDDQAPEPLAENGSPA
ncbi:DUF6011 domain-containing protein [Streptomyces longwoodensis]|uniref:DUF6011 domain-containing protein n=1 Tax=Streptomyces longwoodensis TaxID=68231 RepID=UPI002255B13C|nr:DUF6011 domain-containing protein [Streptomyces longwoodensis]MCX4993810.1 DUF6011 domain-containing protein [Streptomyces longwoodensis]MCX4998070.1 DUF6011 domain-containing protein [Streptomyces longwoodensis]